MEHLSVRWILLTLALSTFVHCETECPTLVTREEWGALPPKLRENITEKVIYQFVHHAAGWFCSTTEECKAAVRDIQYFHMFDEDHLWNDIGYTFLIGGDGNLYEGRGWGTVGAHTQGFNTNGYGTCFLGNFMETLPQPEAINTYMQFLECAVDTGQVVPDYELYGHRQAKPSTLCPGDMLYQIIQSWPHWTPGSPTVLSEVYPDHY